MKKIEVLMKGKKFTEKLFGLRKKAIYRALEDASDEIERQSENAQIDYEQNLLKLTEDDCNYKMIINNMIHNQETIMNASETLKVIQTIKDDLNSEVDENL